MVIRILYRAYRICERGILLIKPSAITGGTTGSDERNHSAGFCGIMPLDLILQMSQSAWPLGQAAISSKGTKLHDLQLRNRSLSGHYTGCLQ